jgi:transposase
LIQQLRRSAAATPDETSWKVGGRLWWLWAFATPDLTVYAIQRGRGFEQAAAVLGQDYAGELTHDGWAVYDKFLRATHQTCLGHLNRRCKEMIALARSAATARFPQQVRAILHAAGALRDRRAEGEIRAHGLAVARGRLLARLERAWAPRFRNPDNERLANHLYRQKDALFRFLQRPGMDATNWRAEQALRPLVVIRKVWGGNRTPAGARTQQILGSLLRTCWQQHRSVVAILTKLLCSPRAKPIHLLRRKRSPPATVCLTQKYRQPKAA